MNVIFFSEFEQLGAPPCSKIERKALRMFAFSIRRVERTRVFYDVDKTVFGSTSDPSSFSKVGRSSLSCALKSVN